MSLTNSMIESYRRWFTYERNAHALVLDSLRRLDNSQQASPLFQKAVDLMAHVVAARRMWLFRFGFAKENAELFPRNTQLESLPLLLKQMEESWSLYLDSLADPDLDRVFEYQSYEGPRFRNTIGDILTQLFGHSWESLQLLTSYFGREKQCK